MEHSLLYVLALLISFMLLGTAFFVWSRQPHSGVHIAFLLSFAFLGLYGLTNSVFKLACFYSGRLFLPLLYMDNILILLVGPAFYRFCDFFPFARKTSSSRWMSKWIAYGITVVAAILTFSDEFIGSQRCEWNKEIGGYLFSRDFGYLFLPVNLVSAFILVLGIGVLVRKYKSTVNRLEKDQIIFVLSGVIVTAVFFLFTILLAPALLDQYEYIAFGNISPLALCIMTAYAVVTSGMFDIRIAYKKILLHVVTSAMLFSLLCVIIMMLFSDFRVELTFRFLFIALAGLLVFYYLIIRVQPRVIELFLGEGEATEGLSQEFASRILVLTTAREVMTNFLSFLTDRMGVSGAAILIQQNSAGGKAKFVSERDGDMLESLLTMIRCHMDKHGPLLSDETESMLYLDALGEDELRRRLNLRWDSELAKRLMGGEVKILIALRRRGDFGLILVGPKQDGKSYYRSDINLLSGINRSLTIALSNEVVHMELVALKNKLRRENVALTEYSTSLSRRIGGPDSRFEPIFQSDRMTKVMETVDKVAESEATILIRGETGSGKEMIADMIHYQSGRKEKPFIKLNCGAIPENLIENELFGHERGAFTGADGLYRGKFEQANGGTLFLDEIGDLPAKLQVKLLRVIQERSFERIGGEKTIGADIRLILATHRELENLVEAGTFRQDLYYRINVIQIFAPPLRERMEDLPILVEYFVDKFASENDRPAPGVTTEAMETLKQYPWPGNIRELQNVLLRAVLLTESEVITNNEFQALALGETVSGSNGRPVDFEGSLSEYLEGVERSIIQTTLEKFNGNQSRAARHLGLHAQSLFRKIKRFGIG